MFLFAVLADSFTFVLLLFPNSFMDFLEKSFGLLVVTFKPLLTLSLSPLLLFVLVLSDLNRLKLFDLESILVIGNENSVAEIGLAQCFVYCGDKRQT